MDWPLNPSILPSDFIPYEVPLGTIDGSNPTFTIANIPPSGYIQLFKNGIEQQPNGGNYTLSGNTITYNAGSIPTGGASPDYHWCNYWII